VNFSIVLMPPLNVICDDWFSASPPRGRGR
jgi:hypothetical protein